MFGSARILTNLSDIARLDAIASVFSLFISYIVHRYNVFKSRVLSAQGTLILYAFSKIAIFGLRTYFFSEPIIQAIPAVEVSTKHC